MRSALRGIRSGKFARAYIREMETGARSRASATQSWSAPDWKSGARLRGL